LSLAKQRLEILLVDGWWVAVSGWEREREREREVMIICPKALGKISLHIWRAPYIHKYPRRKEEDLMHTP
jgi:hypothetical protein